MKAVVSPSTSVHVARRAAHEELRAVTGVLIGEFAGHLPAGTVIRHVARAREQLLSSGVRSGLASAAESMARVRLNQLLPVHTGAATRRSIGRPTPGAPTAVGAAGASPEPQGAGAVDAALADELINSLFRVGLTLHVGLQDPLHRSPLPELIDDVDRVIQAIRRAVQPAGPAGREPVVPSHGASLAAL